MSRPLRQLRIEPPDTPGSRVELRVKPGDRVRTGDLLALVETEKASQEFGSV